MHSLGAYDGESAGAIVDRMKMWVEFLWGVATGTTPTGVYIRDLDHPDLVNYFPGDLTATNLFATGIVKVRKDPGKVAMGALLHIAQDRFSEAHTERDLESGAQCGNTGYDKPGQIQRFHSYTKQSSASHDEADTVKALALHTMQISPSAVDVSRAFLTLWNENKPWSEVSEFCDCVFDVKDREVEADAGRYVAQVREDDVYRPGP